MITTRSSTTTRPFHAISILDNYTSTRISLTHYSTIDRRQESDMEHENKFRRAFAPLPNLSWDSRAWLLLGDPSEMLLSSHRQYRHYRTAHNTQTLIYSSRRKILVYSTIDATPEKIMRTNQMVFSCGIADLREGEVAHTLYVYDTGIMCLHRERCDILVDSLSTTHNIIDHPYSHVYVVRKRILRYFGNLNYLTSFLFVMPHWAFFCLAT